MCALDCTYLTSCLAQLQIHEKRGLVGGSFKPDDPMHSFAELTEDFDSTSIKKSGAMCEWLLWDPSAVNKVCLSACALPVESNFSGINGSVKGNLYMCHLVGTILKESDDLIKGIICDSHGTHQYTKKLLFGQLDDLPMEEIEQLPFWHELSYVDVPQSEMPRMPVKIAMHRGSALWPLPGSCDLAVIGKDCLISFCRVLEAIR